MNQNLSSDHLLSGVNAEYKKSWGGVNSTDGTCLGSYRSAGERQFFIPERSTYATKENKLNPSIEIKTVGVQKHNNSKCFVAHLAGSEKQGKEQGGKNREVKREDSVRESNFN